MMRHPQSTVDNWRTIANNNHLSSSAITYLEWMTFYHKAAEKNTRKTTSYFGIALINVRQVEEGIWSPFDPIPRGIAQGSQKAENLGGDSGGGIPHCFFVKEVHEIWQEVAQASLFSGIPQGHLYLVDRTGGPETLSLPRFCYPKKPGSAQWE